LASIGINILLTSLSLSLSLFFKVHFDPRCRTSEASSVLLIALDKDFARVVARCSGGPSRFRPLLIHADRFFFRFSSQPQGGAESGWGYRFTALPLLGLQWLRETQVLGEPSLEWACWLLDLLLAHAAAGLLPRGAVHNSRVRAS